MNAPALTRQVKVTAHYDQHLLYATRTEHNGGTLGYERVYLPVCKVEDTPFHIQEDDLYVYVRS